MEQPNGNPPGDPPGPGWWLASDGRYYPPQPAPAAQGSQPPQPTMAHCTNCGNLVQPAATACTACGFAPRSARNYCRTCGTNTNPGQLVCTACGTGLSGGESGGDKDRNVAAILAILLGWLGVHKFYLGRNAPGAILLTVSVVSFCCGWFLLLPFLLLLATTVIGIVEGVIYLGKSPEEFQRIYVDEGRDWF